jgi:hypothetical protein
MRHIRILLLPFLAVALPDSRRKAPPTMLAQAY